MRAQVSGSTATVLAVAGWQATVASVGDSCAYLDTGSEVMLVRLIGRLALCFPFPAIACVP